MSFCRTAENHPHCRANPIFYIKLKDEKVRHYVCTVDLDNKGHDTLSNWLQNLRRYQVLGKQLASEACLNQ